MTEEKIKKPIFKRWWFWVGAVVVFFVIVGALSGGGSADPDAAPTQGQEAQQEEESTNKPGISMEEFNQLKSGMTYEEATEIIGGPGEVISESGNPGEDLHTVMYQYEGESGFGANANIMFQGNKLNTKSQFGLE